MTLVAVAALLAAAPAQAGPLTEIDTGTNTRFELTGERVLMWAAEGGTLSVREPDGSRRALYRARRFRARQSLIDRVSLHGGQLAVLTEGWDALGEGGKDWSSVRTGPFDGPYDIVAGREGGSTVAGPIAIALAPAGTLVALNDRSNHRTLELRPADGSAPVLLGAGAEQLVVNGRYAATRDNERAAAYDLETRTRIARVAVDSDPGFSGPPIGISASGTLVYTDRAERLWSYVPATRAKTKLLSHVPEVVRVVGERAYVVQRRKTSPFTHLDRLASLDLAGGAPRPLTAALPDAEFVTDGARLLSAQPGPCVFYGDVPAAAPDRAPATARCGRDSLRFDVTETHKRPRVRMWVTCPGGAADRCNGTAKLTAKGRRLGRWRFSVAGGTGTSHVMKVKLRRGKRRHIARLRVTGSPTRPITRRIVFLR